MYKKVGFIAVQWVAETGNDAHTAYEHIAIPAALHTTMKLLGQICSCKGGSYIHTLHFFPAYFAMQ